MRKDSRPRHRPDHGGSVPAWHGRYLGMLPAMQEQARFAFRALSPDAREEAIQETLANALAQYVRLVRRRRQQAATPTTLVRYAVAQVRVGREVAARMNSEDVLSPYARRRRKLRLERLEEYDDEEETWRDVVVEDKRTTPAEVACFRVDFSEWLRTLSRRIRDIALALANGEGTGAAAAEFGLSPARISQLRRELKQSWEEFQHAPIPAE